MSLKRCLLIVCLLLVSALSASAATTTDRDALYASALTAFDQGLYGKAADSLTQLVDDGVSNGPLFYDIGVCRLHEGKIGMARLWFDRASYYMPADPDLRQNAVYTASQVGTSGDDIAGSTILNILLLPEYLSTPMLFALTACCSLLFWGVLIFRRVWPKAAASALGALSGLLGGIAFFLIVCSSVVAWQNLCFHQGYIVVSQAAVRTGNTQSATLLDQLPDGTAVRIVGRMEKYVRIQYEDKKEGWVQKEDVLER